eukprot:TRINITY_DN45258_c0_g1_i1.p1 TRINITY_DN45258_c0_g1~~TRINITY_DN45258_c0_g1_i1.p1  ORF type:complete len:215 (+),score=13.96 TRINITY_DN45258_c0_g1_i1:34-678(+)
MQAPRQGSTFGEWLQSLPPVTRLLLYATVGSTVIVAANLLPPMLLILHPGLVFSQMQLWRLITNLFWLGPVGFHLIYEMYILINYGAKVEREIFRGDTARFIWWLIIAAVLFDTFGLLLKMPLMSQSLVPMLLYQWCRTNPNVVIQFLFEVKIRSLYFPWVLMGFQMLLGSPIKPYLVGCVVGHVYFYFTTIRPVELFEPPEWVVRASQRLSSF